MRGKEKRQGDFLSSAIYKAKIPKRPYAALAAGLDGLRGFSSVVAQLLQPPLPPQSAA